MYRLIYLVIWLIKFYNKSNVKLLSENRMLNTVQILQILFYVIVAAAVLATFHFFMQFSIYRKQEKAKLRKKKSKPAAKVNSMSSSGRGSR